LIGILYLAFFIKGVIISKNSEDPFGQLLSFGITCLFTLHAFLNIGISIGIVPPTGVSLPFISYGGSSMLIMAIGCGILLNISSAGASGKQSRPVQKEIKEIIDDGF
jgi:cell division protein FtsW